MHKVGIVGAGIGGSYLSYLLSKEGVDTIVFDFMAPHEKLCGGGIPYKAIEKFPVINELDCPRNVVWKSTVISPKDSIVSIELEKPLTIFNRRDLDYSLLKMAREYGAHFKRERVRTFTQEGNHWRILTEESDYEAEILVGADGALSKTRKTLNLPPRKEGPIFALECFIDVRVDCVTFKFFPNLIGYLWAFPRVDRLGVGIVSRYYRAQRYNDMKNMLLNYIEEHFPEKRPEVSLRGAFIPFFSADDVQVQPICSENWALIGDAASFVDPISSEGIYYTMYSAAILASCIIENRLSYYQRLCMKHFGENLAEAFRSFTQFYQDEFIETMVSMTKKSRAMRKFIAQMIAGDINYLSWKQQFKREFVKILGDLIFNFGFVDKREEIADLIRWYWRHLSHKDGHMIS